MLAMQRYLSLVLLFLIGSIFLVHPALEVQGAQSPVPLKTSKQPTTTVKSSKKTATAVQSSAAAKTQTAQQPALKSQPTAKSTASATEPSKAKQQQAAASSPTPAKPNSVAGGVKQPQVVKPTQPAAVTKRASRSPQTAKTRKKAASRSAEAPVYSTVPAGSVSDIDKQISARSVMVMDAESGGTIFEKMPDNPRQPASTIKIVTAMIALKSLQHDDIIDVSSHAASMPSSKIFLDPGRNYRANDLINAVLLASANDASVALAEKIAGSEDKFANLMTLSARMWGARNTICRTASGLTAVGQQSTARDLANLFRYAMQHDEFARRVHEKFISTSYGKSLRNHNRALWRLDGAVGGKTGYTVAARQTYVGQFTRDDQTIVVAIMGSESMWADLEKLVNYGFQKKKEGQLARVGSVNATGKTTQVN
jgi:D-alanyl-D-alanine carboxypeptidase (penicillin-binding protein 5/6)